MGIINNLINTLKDNFTMAEFNINGRMTVKSLKETVQGCVRSYFACV